MASKKSLRSDWASIFGPKKHVDDGSMREQQEANISQASMEREVPLEPETSRPGRTKPGITSDQPRGHVVDERQQASTSQATMERGTSFQPETMPLETTIHQAQRLVTNTNPVANAIFSGVGNVAIHGGQFMQTNAAKSDRRGFELLQKQVASSAFHNSAERIDPARCHPDTRVDVMQTIYDWITKSGQRDEWLLWLNGAAGAGKSAIMQSVAERCVLAAIAIASFFFVRADATRNIMAPFVATLVYQLIQEIPETSNDILFAIERNPLIFKQSLESQLQKLIIQPLLSLPTHLQRLFVVFIDGLDECLDRAHQSNLIKLLGHVSSGRNIPVIFVIGSRREPQIEAEFCEENVAGILTTIPLDDIQASDDIRRFLNAKFKKIKATHLRRKLLSPDWPTSAVIEQIVEKSSGQFIYASVVIGYISLPHGHPAFQLDIINGIRPRNPSENPFAYLDALYQYIFSQVKRLDIVRNILAFNLATNGSFFILNLEALFQLAPGELEVLFADLTAVIDCSNSHSGIKILHASLPDFLLDKSRSGDHYIDLDEYKANLLYMFLERPCTDLHSSTHRLAAKYGLTSLETPRIWAICDLLETAKASTRLQRAAMNFNVIFDNPELLSYPILQLLDTLKCLNFDDQGQAYCHVVDVFAAEYSKYWSSNDENQIEDDTKCEIKEESPDLVARINEILQHKELQM